MAEYCSQTLEGPKDATASATCCSVHCEKPLEACEGRIDSYGGGGGEGEEVSMFGSLCWIEIVLLPLTLRKSPLESRSQTTESHVKVINNPSEAWRAFRALPTCEELQQSGDQFTAAMR